MTINDAGRYLVSFTANITSTSGPNASVALARNNAQVPGTQIPLAGSTGNPPGQVMLQAARRRRPGDHERRQPALTLGPYLHHPGASLTIQRIG